MHIALVPFHFDAAPARLPLREQVMQLAVNQSAFGASGGSYLVRYRAEISINASSGVTVVVASTYPNDPTPEEVASATDAIREGIERVLAPRNLGASVTVHDLTIHPVDFNPRKFADWTAVHLERLLDETG